MFKDENRHYSLRKLSIGLASVLIGISFASGMNSNSVKADTVNSDCNSTQTVVKNSDAATKIDTKNNANAAESNTESTPEATKKDPNVIAQDIKQKAMKASEDVTKMQAAAEKIAKGNAPEAAVKNMPDGSQDTTESTLKGTNLIAKQQNTAVKGSANTGKDGSTKNDSLTAKNNALKATVEAAKQGLETPVVPHSDGNEAVLNIKSSNAIAENMLKEGKVEVKNSQYGSDPAKSKLKMAALLATTGKKLNVQMLSESKVVSPAKDTNGGFDSSWGKLDVNAWQGHVQGDYYQLTAYTGDANHVIVPNAADFEKAGISTSGKQVGVTSDLMKHIFKDKATARDATVAFSKTDNKMIKAINSDWSNTWNSSSYFDAVLSKFDGINLDVSNVTNMNYMFGNNRISDLISLANWNVNNVTNMHSMFARNQISDLSPLAGWNTNNVADMSQMFYGNYISDLSPLANWKVDNVTNMNYMFGKNHISDLSPLANWNVNNVTDMSEMFIDNQISDLNLLGKWNVNNVTNMYMMFTSNQIKDLSPLGKWNVNNVTNMYGMFGANQISDLSPLANWKVDNVQTMRAMFVGNRISDISSLANWKVDNVTDMQWMFDSNSSIQTKTTPAKRIINFVYPAGYTGKKQNPVMQTVDVPNKQVKIELTTKDSKPSNNILDWVTKTETPETPDPVYFQDYTVPEIKGLLEPDKTVIAGQQADITKPINVIVTYKLADSNTNDAFALDSKNGLHEHANVNNNGGYDEDFWGKINVDDWNYTVNGDTITINGLKNGISTGANDAVIVPNLEDFKLAGKDSGAKTVYISNDALGINAKHKYYGLSKTNGNTFATDSDLSLVFYKNSNLTHADLNSLNTSNVTNMNYMFSNAKSLTDLDVSNWDTGRATTMTAMFIGASSLTNLDASKWNTSNVTNMGRMFTNASSLTNLDVSHWDTSKVTDMHAMFYNASSLTSLDVSHWDTSKVTNMRYMFDGARSLMNLNVSNWDISKVTNMRYMFNDANKLALIVNGDKFADYLVKNNFADSGINSSVKSVTTDNTKLLQLLTNDGQHDSATRTIVFTFPAGYSPDLIKYHLTKTGNTYQIKQSIDYNKPYVQGTVLINATDDITKHHIDTTKPNKLSDTWQPNYDKLVLAHKNSDGSVSFDAIQLPKVPGYKAVAKTVASPVNPARALFAVSFMALSKPVTPAINDAKPAKTVTPTAPVVIEVAKSIKTEPKVTTTLKVIDLSDDAVSIAPKETTWQVANNLEHDTYRVSNGKYTVELPHISNAQLHVIANDSTKDSVLFTYKGQNTKYVFNIKFVNGHYLLTTYGIKSGKLVKLIDYNFIKSSKMIDTILDWIKR